MGHFQEYRLWGARRYSQVLPESFHCATNRSESKLGCNSSLFWHLKEQYPHCLLSNSSENNKKSEENSCFLTDNPGSRLAKPHILIISHHGRKKKINLLNRSQSLKTSMPGKNFHHVQQGLDLGFLLRPIYNINPHFCSFPYLFFN